MKPLANITVRGFIFCALMGLILCSGAIPATASDASDLRAQAFDSLWHEHADHAVALFHLYLAQNPQGQDSETLRGLALALSWNGQQKEAETIYRQLLQDNPLDGEAHVGLARAQIWDNRLAQGWHNLRQAETDPKLSSPHRGSAGDFALKVLDEYTPRSLSLWRGTWDSDDLQIHRLATFYATTVAHDWLLQTGPRISLISQPGQPTVTATRWQAKFTTALTPKISFHGLGWWERFRSGSPLAGTTDNLSWVRPGGDVWLTWQASSTLRFDGGAASQPIETYLAFARKIGYQQESLSGDWRLGQGWSVGLSGIRATYSDSNRKLQGRVLLGWRHEGAMELDLHTSFTQLDFTRAYPGGYWSPDWVRNGSFSAKAKLAGHRFVATVEGSVGLEREADAKTITVGGGSAHLGLRVARNWLLSFEGGHSRSSFSTASGYNRTFVGWAVRGNF